VGAERRLLAAASAAGSASAFAAPRNARPSGDALENPMAVQQNKKSPSKRGMHRAHNALTAPGTGIEPTTGEVHLRHHISPTGFYRGRKVLKAKTES
jgi:large subunit ribosomal protein L32